MKKEEQNCDLKQIVSYMATEKWREPIGFSSDSYCDAYYVPCNSY